MVETRQGNKRQNDSKGKLTRNQIDALLERLRDPKLAHQFLLEAGLVDSEGQLTPPYRSQDTQKPYKQKMDSPKLDQTSVEVRNAALFVVAALSPSFLISSLAVLVYLSNSYPAIGSVVNKAIENLVGRFSKGTPEDS